MPRVVPLCVLAALCSWTTMAAVPPAPDALTESSAASWNAEADGATAGVFDDTSRVKVGSSSLRFETDGCMDTYLWAPGTDNGDWDLLAAGSGGVGFWVYAENDNLGFQGPMPAVRLGTSYFDYFEYIPSQQFLNQARNQWVYVQLPLNGDSVWQVTTVGSPDLSHINYIEIHADTWDCGFTLWFDGLTFEVQLSPPEGQFAIAGNGQVSLEWLPFTDMAGLFDHYAIYRSTSAFTDVSGMTPVHTISGINNTTWTDTGLTNGVAYYYAVTAVFTNGSETSQVDPVGPRVPRDETDLQITCISRTPRYPRYDPLYTGYWVTEPSGYGPYWMTAATGLGSGQTGATQRWPNMGDSVTYTATVRNRGTNTWTGTLSGTWSVDGTPASTPSQSVTLQPNDTTIFTYVQLWDNEWHEITFTLDESDARPENNERNVYTKSAPFLTYVDIGAIEDFRDRTSPEYPNRATDDLIDWLQRHADEMNQMFADAGSLKRVHYDVLKVLHDYDPDPASPARINFGIFPFRYYTGTIGDPRSPGYYHADVDIDYGLCHEMSHQLGLIDLYQLNVSADQNTVSGQGYSAPAGLMNGCSPFYSEHSAGGMTAWADVVHGYFGQYMYDIPAQIKLRILDFEDNPLPNATVTMYQKQIIPGGQNVIWDQPKAQGVTDANGEWTLPNVPIDPNMVPTTYAGDTLPDNPFGYLAVVGWNGVLHFKVQDRGFVDYAWLDITEVNNAYWAGQTDVAVFERQLGIGGEVQQYPPADMAELNVANWSSWAQDGTITLYDDTTVKHVGQGSIRADATGGFDNYIRYPYGMLAQWDLSAVQEIRFWAYAENDNGFQSQSPTVRLGSFENGYFEFKPSWDILNQARGQWREFVVPIDGDSLWTRTSHGTPDLSSINYLEIHADTWDYGFTLWLDGVRFDPTPVPPSCPGDYNCDGQRDFFDIDYLLAALGGESAWASFYADRHDGATPPCAYLANCDANSDGSVDFFDIDAFLAALGSACE